MWDGKRKRRGVTPTQSIHRGTVEAAPSAPTVHRDRAESARPVWRVLGHRPLGIRGKMLLTVSVLIVLSVTVMLFFSVRTYTDKLTRNNLTYSGEIVKNLMENMNDYFHEVIAMTNLAVFNHGVQNFLQLEKANKQPDNAVLSPDNSKNLSISSEIFGNAMNARSDTITTIIVNDYGVRLFNSIYALNDTAFDFRNQDWYKRAVEANGKPVITGPHYRQYLARSREPVYAVSRQIESSMDGSKLGVILIDANLNRINTLCDSIRPNSNGRVLIFDGNGDLVYQPEHNPLFATSDPNASEVFFRTLSADLARNAHGNGRAVVAGVDVQYVYQFMEKCGWTLMVATPYESLMADARNVRNLILLIGVICLAAVIGISYLFLARITHPLLRLKQLMDMADHGNLSVRATLHSRDEVGDLASSFNHMLDRIESLMSQVVAEQELKRKSELNALQAQINPHFLYNTLESIIWMAECKSDKVVPTTEALARFFRISLSRGKELIPIADELEHVRNYLFIQSMRYINKFDYEIAASDAVKQCRILKITLQPLVENAIYHGIKNRAGKGLIRIQATMEGERVFIAVSDDGIGMTPEQVERVLQEPDTPVAGGGSGVGVRNVHERIRLCFGEEYGLRFESTPGEGTTAYVCLPVVRDEV